MADIANSSRKFTIKRVGKNTRKDIKCIAARKGITITRFLLPQITEIVSKHKKIIGESIQCEPSGEICIRGIGKQTKKDLKEIADFYHIDMGDLLKLEFAQMTLATPEHLKTEMDK